MELEYQKQGYFIVENVVNKDQVTALINTLSVFESQINHYGIRDLMNKVPDIRKLALSSPLLSIAKKILGDKAQPVRSIFFDKLPDANWNVAWHQDTSIAVNFKEKLSGFNYWREKQGVMHVEPPEHYLSNILTLRLHLDPANTVTGVLRVIPKSHKAGRVSSNNILKLVEHSNVIECTANPGDLLLLNPLLFHSSRKANQPDHRRIIHLEYSAMLLPEPLAWFESM